MGISIVSFRNEGFPKFNSKYLLYLACVLSRARPVPLWMYPIQQLNSGSTMCLASWQSLPCNLSALPNDVLNANTVNLTGVIWFQPFHCDLLGFLKRFVLKGVRFPSFSGQINTAVSVNTLYIRTCTSKEVYTRTTCTLYAICWLWILMILYARQE